MTAVFLSYASADVDLAAELHDELRDAGYATVFRDRDRGQGIPAGARWAQELFTQLERADVVVLLATASSLASAWCHTELAVAVARGRHVVQVGLTPGPPHPVLSDRQCLPVARDVRELVDGLVRDLARVGFPATDPFGWDPGESPYPGLRRLDQRHAAVLFGRDEEVSALFGRLAPAGAPPVLVVGPSGSGKSSLVRAGLLPRLALQPDTLVLPAVEPGRSPLRRVAAAVDVALDRAHLRRTGHAGPSDTPGFADAVDRLTAQGGRVVLVLDQAEDMLAPPVRDEAAQLLARLGEVDRTRLCLVVVLRSASLEPWMRDTALAGIAPGDPVWVRPLDRAGLRDVVVRPARLAGIRIEPPELVERVLDDTGDGYALPLLAALLEELAEGHSRLTPAVISAERYRELGPVSRVVERRAAAALAQLQAEQGADERTAVQAYLRLVDVSGEGQVTRAEVVLAELPSDVVGVLTVLEQHRLVARDRRVVDGEQAREVVTPVHEEVFRAWPALRTALDEQRADLELRSALRREARTWQSSGGGRVLLAGGRLERALDWARRRPEEVEALVAAYLRAAAREKRRRRALLVAAPLLVLAVVVVGGLAASLAVQADRAEQARDLAEGLRLAGEARTAGASRPDLGLQLALEAATRGSDQQLQAAPLVALTRGSGPRRYQPLPGPVTDGALDATGERAVLVRAGDTLLWDAAGGQTAARLPPASVVALSGDGRVLVAATASPAGAPPRAAELAVHEWASAEPLTSCKAPDGSVELLRLTSAGDRLVVVTADRGRSPPVSTVTVLALPTCERVSADAVTGLVVDADADATRDRLVLAVSHPGAAPPAARSSVQVWQLSSGLPFEPLAAAPGVVRAVAQDDTQVAALTTDGDLLVWPSRSYASPPSRVAALPVAGELLRALPPAGPGSPGRWLAVGVDGGLRVLTAAGALDDLRYSLPGLGWTGALAPSALAAVDGAAVTLDPSGRLVSWDLRGGVALGDVVLPDEQAAAVVARAAGDTVVAGREDVWHVGADGATTSLGVAGVTALAAGRDVWVAGARDGRVLAGQGAAPPVQIGLHQAPVRAVAVLPGGGLASVDERGGLRVRDGTGAVAVAELGEEPRSMAAAGPRLYVGTRRGTVLVVDPAQLDAAPLVQESHREDASAAASSRDGRWLATGGDDRTVVVWAVGDDGALSQRWRLVGQSDRVTGLSFSADGNRLAAGGEDRAVVLWDLQRGEQIGSPITLPVVSGVAFAGVGEREQLLVAGQGLARWPMSPSAWSQTACRVLGGAVLGEVERAQFLRGAAPAHDCDAADPGP